MAALSTGGFSNKAASIGAYNSFPIEIITILIMLAGSVNFAVMLVLVRGKVKNFFKATEVRFLGVLLVIIDHGADPFLLPLRQTRIQFPGESLTRFQPLRPAVSLQ